MVGVTVSHTISACGMLLLLGACASSTDPREATSPPQSGAPDLPLGHNDACPDGVYPESIAIMAQSGLESLRSCTRVRGDLIIAGADVVDLTALRTLELIEGHLRIGARFASPAAPGERIALANLSGLERVRSARTLELSALDVSDLSGLSGLRDVTQLSLDALDSLHDLSGLEGLSWQSASITKLPGLESLHGLTVAESVETLQLEAAPLLNDLSALEPLRSIRELTLSVLPEVRSLAALGNLRQVEVLFHVSACPGLVDLSGLGGIETRGTIFLYSNAQLRSLDGLRLSGRPGGVSIYDHPELTELSGLISEEIEGIAAMELAMLPRLSSLRGLAGLPELATLALGFNNALSDLSGLDGLSEISGQLLVGACNNLQSLHGLENLKQIGLLSLQSLPMLNDIQALRRLERVEGLLTLSDLPLLASLDGLAGLSQADELTLAMTKALGDLRGLEQLTKLDRLGITGNDALLELSGLENLGSGLAMLTISDNPKLRSIAALSGVERVDAAVIQNNRALPQCEVMQRGERWMSAIMSSGNDDRATW